MTSTRSFDVVVIGAGPAGMAAAYTACGGGVRVGLVDDNPASGGQIWRGETGNEWFEAIGRAPIETLYNTRVIGLAEPGSLISETDSGPADLRFAKLILATGARERFIPFPGWTLPNVTGAGGLQALAKGGLDIGGKRVVVAGTGPLLLAVGAYLRKQGAEVVMILEQAPPARIASFGRAVLRKPGKLLEAASLTWRLRRVPYLMDSWPVAADGDGRLEEVVIQSSGKRIRAACDYLACGFGLVPNVELAAVAGCRVTDGAVAVDEWQRTTVRDIYCAGEPTGVGGLELALVQGRIAGFAATGDQTSARHLFESRASTERFRDSLARAFRLRDELKQLASPETLVCRCEDVPLSKLAPHESWRAIKLHTRCGMGPCQGRICGPAVEFLRGIPPDSARPPVYPASVGCLASWAAKKTDGPGL